MPAPDTAISDLTVVYGAPGANYSDAPVCFYNGGTRLATGFDNKAYGNNVLNWVTSFSRASIGAADATDYNFEGRLYSIRLYNCPLSDREIAYNAAVDKVRYDGVDPAEAFNAPDMRWNAASGKVEVLIKVGTVHGAGTLSINGGGTNEWVSIGDEVYIEYKPASGEKALEWFDLPDGAPRTANNFIVDFTAEAPVSAKLQMLKEIDLSRALNADPGIEEGSGSFNDGANSIIAPQKANNSFILNNKYSNDHPMLYPQNKFDNKTNNNNSTVGSQNLMTQLYLLQNDKNVLANELKQKEKEVNFWKNIRSDMYSKNQAQNNSANNSINFSTNNYLNDMKLKNMEKTLVNYGNTIDTIKKQYNQSLKYHQKEIDKLKNDMENNVNMAYNKATGTVIILDNSTTGMTGHQDNPATGKMLNGETTYAIDLEKLCKAMNINHVTVVDPYDLEKFEEVVKTEVARDELSVIIAQSPCALLKDYIPQGKCYVDPDKCRKCGKCLVAGCPAIKKDKETGKAVIDDTMCNGCGLCMKNCPFDAISLKKRGE